MGRDRQRRELKGGRKEGNEKGSWEGRVERCCAFAQQRKEQCSSKTGVRNCANPVDWPIDVKVILAAVRRGLFVNNSMIFADLVMRADM